MPFLETTWIAPMYVLYCTYLTEGGCATVRTAEIAAVEMPALLGSLEWMYFQDVILVGI
jgi:hypothetical protein